MDVVIQFECLNSKKTYRQTVATLAPTITLNLDYTFDDAYWVKIKVFINGNIVLDSEKRNFDFTELHEYKSMNIEIGLHWINVDKKYCVELDEIIVYGDATSDESPGIIDKIEFNIDMDTKKRIDNFPDDIGLYVDEDEDDGYIVYTDLERSHFCQADESGISPEVLDVHLLQPRDLALLKQFCTWLNNAYGKYRLISETWPGGDHEYFVMNTPGYVCDSKTTQGVIGCCHGTAFIRSKNMSRIMKHGM